MNIKSYLFMLMLCSGAFFFNSCGKEEVETIVDSSQPSGVFTTLKTGSIIAQSDTGTKGTVSLGTDASGIAFLRLGSDFQTVLATGTVTIYLSTSSTFKADPGNGNPDLKIVGFVSKNGESFYKIGGTPDSKFNHVIFWCGTAGVPFGNVNIK